VRAQRACIRLFGTSSAEQRLVMGLPFRNSHAKRRDQIVAIDLGARVTKAVHVQRRNEKFSLLDYALVDAPANEQSVSVESLSNHLKDVMKGFTRNTKYVSLAVGVSDCVFKQIELPLMPVGDMRQMLKFNAKNYLQQDLPDHVFDCCYLVQKAPVTAPEAGKNPSSGGTTFRTAQKQKVVIGGAPRQVIDEFASAIRMAGFLPEQIVPGIVGPLNAFELAQAESFSKEVVALVEIGFNNSTITILDGGELMLNRVLAIGGNRLTDTLAEAMGITYAEAEGIKVGMPTEVQPNLESALHPLGRELRASLDFFETHNDKTVGTVFISGGSAQSEFIIETLQNELMVPCKSWNPAGFMEVAVGPEKLAAIEQAVPQLSVAIGTALAAL
jgi:type IV pilus assembly protein PilM